MKKSNRKSRRHSNPTNSEENKKPFFPKVNQPTIQTKSEDAFFQPKLTIGEPNDKYEKEADAMADEVVNKSSNTPVVQAKNISSIQRYMTNAQEDEMGTNTQRIEKDKEIQEKPEVQMTEEEEPIQKMEEEESIQKMKEEEPIQKMEEEESIQQMEEQEPIQKMEEEEPAVQTKSNTGGGTTSPQVTSQINASKGKGSTLSDKTNQEMSTAFGYDFSDVKVHTGSESEKMNQELGAQAFTNGQDVYFNQGKYSPESGEGKKLLAHELTHVVQQKGEGMIKKNAPETIQRKRGKDINFQQAEIYFNKKINELKEQLDSLDKDDPKFKTIKENYKLLKSTRRKILKKIKNSDSGFTWNMTNLRILLQDPDMAKSDKFDNNRVIEEVLFQNDIEMENRMKRYNNFKITEDDLFKAAKSSFTATEFVKKESRTERTINDLLLQQPLHVLEEYYGQVVDKGVKKHITDNIVKSKFKEESFDLLFKYLEENENDDFSFAFAAIIEEKVNKLSLNDLFNERNKTENNKEYFRKKIKNKTGSLSSEELDKAIGSPKNESNKSELKLIKQIKNYKDLNSKKTRKSKRQKVAEKVIEQARNILGEIPNKVKLYKNQSTPDIGKKTKLIGQLLAEAARMEFLLGTIYYESSAAKWEEINNKGKMINYYSKKVLNGSSTAAWCSVFVGALHKTALGMKEINASTFQSGWKIRKTLPDTRDGGDFVGLKSGNKSSSKNNPWYGLKKAIYRIKRMSLKSNEKDKKINEKLDAFFSQHIQPQAGDILVVTRGTAKANSFLEGYSHTTIIEKFKKTEKKDKSGNKITDYKIYTIEGNVGPARKGKVAGRVYDLKNPSDLRKIIYIKRMGFSNVSATEEKENSTNFHENSSKNMKIIDGQIELLNPIKEVVNHLAELAYKKEYTKIKEGSVHDMTSGKP